MSTQSTSEISAEPREQYATVDFLLHTRNCVVCSAEYVARQHNQVTCGADVCRWSRLPYVQRAIEHAGVVERGWARRRAKSTIDLMSQTRGPKMRDKQACVDAEKIVKTKINKYSRCTFCGEEFVDGKGRPTPSGFEFCGESLLTTGECKRSWLASRVAPTVAPVQFNVVTPEDEEKARTKRIHAPKVLKMPRTYAHFCATCVEVVVDGTGKVLRRTKGVYRVIDHECSTVTVRG